MSGKRMKRIRKMLKDNPEAKEEVLIQVPHEKVTVDKNGNILPYTVFTRQYKGRRAIYRYMKKNA